jgi:hypothetical protein
MLAPSVASEATILRVHYVRAGARTLNERMLRKVVKSASRGARAFSS